MLKVEVVSSLIGDIYRAGLEPEAWGLTLEHIGDAFRGTYVAMLMQKHPEPGHYVVGQSSQSSNVIAARADPAYVKQYAAHFAALSPFSELTPNLNTGDVRTDRMVLDRASYLRSEFYNDFVRRQDDTLAKLRACILHEQGRSVFISIGRNSSGGDFNEDDLKLWHLLAPHLRRSFEVSHRLKHQEQNVLGSAEALNALHDGVFLVGKDGGVLFTNKAAEALLRTNSCLGVHAGQIFANNRSQNNALMHLISGASGQFATGGWLKLESEAGDPLALLAVPLQLDRQWPVSDGAVTALFVATGGIRVPDDASLRTIFNMTEGEARVAREIVRGRGMQEVAETLCISKHTVNAHLKSIFEKTRTSRQAELVQRLTKLGVGGNGGTPASAS